MSFIKKAFKNFVLSILIIIELIILIVIGMMLYERMNYDKEKGYPEDNVIEVSTEYFDYCI